MKKTLPFCFSLGLLMLSCVGTTQAQNAEEDSLAISAQDSLPSDNVPIDSARVARMAYQAELSREISALSRTNLGNELHVWTEQITFETIQGGRTQTQRFWYNPKVKDAPHVWQMQTDASNDVFYLDPKMKRAATLNLHTLEGAFIPAHIAEKAGFTGNNTRFDTKKSSRWKESTNDETSTAWVAQEDEIEVRVVVSNEKNAAQAMAVFDWLRLQPIAPLTLPASAQKYPISSVTRIAKGNQELLRISSLEWVTLEAPLEVDASKLQINDPERNLQTIAREWSEEKKAKESAQD